MQIYKQSSILAYHTFKIDVKANSIIIIENESDVEKWIETKDNSPFLVVGEGSNLLFKKGFEGTLLIMKSKGKKIIEETSDYSIVEVAAGEIWHPFVNWTLENGVFGLENMALIPGTVGASPVQNVGAYGAEAKDFIHSVRAFDLEENTWKLFTNKECEFEYRNSHFKRNLGRYIVTSVQYKLQKKANLKTNYGAIQNTLTEMGITNPTPKDVFNAVVEIRSSKLPNVKEIPNAGSFFKNPIIAKEQLNTILEKYPNIVHFDLPNDKVKLAAGWMIDHLGWKGKSWKNAQVYPKQALVLINTGKASGQDIYELSEKIREDVLQNFGVVLEREVQVF
jgi:UDP-N-acetylmuramate dehydrogenase